MAARCCWASCAYARLHGPWSFYVTPGDFEQALPKMRQWGGTGIIARIETQKIADAVLESGLPTIALDLSSRELESRPSAVPSQRSCLRLGRRRRDGRRASVGARLSAFRVRGSGRASLVATPGGGLPSVDQPQRASPWRPTSHRVQGRDRVWEREQPILAEWLQRLPKPVGVMACNDDRGREVLEACRAANSMFPKNLAVIGVDNDELLCELADPPLSSVALNAEGVGYRAAALLDRMMRGIECANRNAWWPSRCAWSLGARRTSSPSTILISPRPSGSFTTMPRKCIPSRTSSSMWPFRAAISRHVSGRLLGRTPHAELQRVRLQRAMRFLVETDLPIPKIAEAVGYTTPSYFIQVFAKSTAPPQHATAVDWTRVRRPSWTYGEQNRIRLESLGFSSRFRGASRWGYGGNYSRKKERVVDWRDCRVLVHAQ
jgi:LacI family transcriptional regulator